MRITVIRTAMDMDMGMLTIMTTTTLMTMCTAIITLMVQTVSTSMIIPTIM